jgi:hypothetical protein
MATTPYNLDKMPRIINNVPDNYVPNRSPNNNLTQAYNGVQSQNDYINQYITAAKLANKPSYDSQLLAAQQAYGRNKLNLEQSRGNIQNAYTTGSNQLGELRTQTAADYQTGQNQINEQRAAQMPQYQQQRNQTNVDAATNARKLREIMAAKGLYRSGSAVGQELGIYNQAAQNRNDITTQENLANMGFANKLSELGTSQANALAGVGNRQAELLQAYNTNLSNLDQQTALYGTQLGDYEQSLAQQYADRMAEAGAQAPLNYENYALNVAGLTGKYGDYDTLPSQQLSQQESQYSRSLAEQIASRQASEGLQKLSLSQQKELAMLQYERMTPAQQQQFNLEAEQLGLSREELAMQKANQQFNQDIIEQQQESAQEQYETDLANQKFNQYLQAAQYGTNALTGIAGVTGQWNQPSGYYPGDVATNSQNYLLAYLKSLGVV